MLFLIFQFDQVLYPWANILTVCELPLPHIRSHFLTYTWEAASPGRVLIFAGYLLSFHYLLQDFMRCLPKDDMKRQLIASRLHTLLYNSNASICWVTRQDDILRNSSGRWIWYSDYYYSFEQYDLSVHILNFYVQRNLHILPEVK